MAGNINLGGLEGQIQLSVLIMGCSPREEVSRGILPW